MRKGFKHSTVPHYAFLYDSAASVLFVAKKFQTSDVRAGFVMFFTFVALFAFFGRNVFLFAPSSG